MHDKASQTVTTTVTPGGSSELGLPEDPLGPLTPGVTIADIYYAYRLILGRAPDAHGWHGLTTLAEGMTRDELVSIFLTHPEFKARAVYAAMLGEDTALPVLAQAGDFALYVSPNDAAVGQTILREGVHEPHLATALRQVLAPGMTFVDVGANVGYFSLLAARRVGATGRVVAVEPNPRNGALLQLSAQHNGLAWIELWPVAAAEQAGAVVFDHLVGSNGLTGAILSAETETVAQLAHKQIVPAQTLDRLLAQAARVDVIKLDIEGGEARALQGARKILARHRPLIFSEFSPGWLQQISGVTAESYLQFLIELGYDLTVLRERESPLTCGQNPATVIDYFAEHAVDHIDLMARPLRHRNWWKFSW